MLICCGFMTLPVGATSPPDIPLDSHGLPLWEIRAYDDFPVRIVLDGRPELNALLAAVPLASFHREQIRVVYDSPESSHLVFETRVTAAEAQSLVSAGYRFERIPDREQELRREMERDWASRALDGFQTKTRNDIFYYPTHAEIGQILAAAAADHPDIAHDFVWGNSVQGRQLWGIVISANVGSEEAEPEIRISSTMHGNEPPGMVMALNLVEYLTDNYGQPGYDDVTNLVDNYEIHILPLHNPDGYIAGTRRNANNIDLNRNFPVPDGSIGDDGTWTEEIETFAFKAYGFHHDFVISENGHSGALVVNYPWDYTYTLAPDDAAIIQLSLEYSSYNLPMYNGSFPQGITNGAQWYVIAGGLQDWSYHETGCIDVTIEYTNTHWPPASVLDDLWDDNRESFMHWIKAARYGVNGVVTGSDTGLPLDATVTVAGIDKPVFTDPDHGDYYKLLDSGSYDLTFSADGYLPQTVYGITTTWGTPTVLNVSLEPMPPTEVVVLFSDDFESGIGQWIGGWDLADPPEGHDSANCMTDSPGAGVDYVSNEDNPSAMIAGVDLTNGLDGSLTFWAKWEIENSWDGCWFQVSSDGGDSWTSIATQYTEPASGQGVQQPAGDPVFDGNQYSWVQNSVDLAPWLGQSDVRFRFHLVSDGSSNRDGFYCDDFVIEVTRPAISGVDSPPARAARLTTAYPNPFNPQTTMRFEIVRTGPIRLAIYDLQGRLVRTLVSEIREVGEHTAVWDGKTEAGLSAASGVYVVRLTAGEERDAMKLTLVK